MGFLDRLRELLGLSPDNANSASQGNATFTPAKPITPVTQQPQWGSTFNTVQQNQPQSFSQVAKSVGGGTVQLAKSIGSGLASFGQSAGEMLVRTPAAIYSEVANLGNRLGGYQPGQPGYVDTSTAERIAYGVVPAKEIPGLRFLGPVQSIQSQASQRLQNGEKSLNAIANATLDTIFNEPVGVAFKPIFLAAGFMFKRGSQAAIQGFANEAANLSEPKAIEEVAKKFFPQADETTIKIFGQRYAPFITPDDIAKDAADILAKVDEALTAGRRTDTQASLPGMDSPLDEITRTRAERLRAGDPQQFRRDALSRASASEALSTVSPRIEDAASRAFERLPEPQTRRIADMLQSAWTKTVEYVQNDAVRVKQLVNRKGVKVTDETDPYLKATLFPGRVQTMMEEGYERARDVADDIVALASDSGLSSDEVRAALNKFLQAQHAPERNIALGDGAAGITTEEAAKVVAETPENVRAIANKVLDLNKKTLDMLKDAGVISDDLFKTLREKYQHHVPLQRVMDEADDISEVMMGRGFDVRSTGIKAAVGSDREVADILTNVVTNYEQAAVRAQKNIVDMATLAFVRANRNVLGNLIEVAKPKVIGKMADGTPIMERTNDPKILQMFENGKPVWLKIKDENLAIALKNVGREKLGPILRAVQFVTRFYAGLATRFNPEFAFSNKLRDVQEMMVYMSAQNDMGFANALKAGANPLAGTKSVVDGIRGVDSEGAKLYREMKEMGGTTGGMGLSTRADVELKLDKVMRLAESSPRRFVEGIARYVDHWNTIFEDSTRLAVYKRALDAGASKERAAFLAKEATINFNRAGKGGPVINALYMFSNASIQGSAKMLQSLKNPKVAAAVATAVGGAVAAVNEWNDRVDPEWRDKVSKWDRLNSLIVMLPNEEGKGTNYMTVPVSWGLKPIKVMTEGAFDMVSGQDVNLRTFSSQLFSSILDAYNPLGGTGFASAVTPTIGDLPLEIATNRSWSGSRIRPTPFQGEPRDIQYFQSLKDTATGRAAISLSENLRESVGILVSPADLKYAYEQIFSGAGRSAQRFFNTVYGFTQKEPPPLDEFPFISRFYRERTQEELEMGNPVNIEAELAEDQRLRDIFHAKQQVMETGESELVGETLVYKDAAGEIKTRKLDSVEERDKVEKELVMKSRFDHDEKFREDAKKIYDHVQMLKGDKGTTKAEKAAQQAFIDSLTDAQYEAYQGYKEWQSNWKSSNTKQVRDLLSPNPADAVQFIRSLPEEEKNRILDLLTEDEYKQLKKGADGQPSASRGTKVLAALTGAGIAEADVIGDDDTQKKGIFERLGNWIKDKVSNTMEYKRGEPVEDEADASNVLKTLRHMESRGEGDGAYSFRQPSGVKELGDALGAYQVTEGELKTYAKRWLGRAVDAAEFLASPEMQDEYMANKIDWLQAKGFTLPQIFAAHRGGFSNLDNKDGMVKKYQQYVDEAMAEYDKSSPLVSAQFHADMQNATTEEIGNLFTEGLKESLKALRAGQIDEAFMTGGESTNPFPRINGKDIVKNLAKEALAAFPFTPLAKGELADIKYRPLETDGAASVGGVKNVQGMFSPAGLDTLVNVRNALPQGLRESIAQKIGEFAYDASRATGLDKPNIEISPELEQSAVSVMSHEMLHALFEKSPMGREMYDSAVAEEFREKWRVAWDDMLMSDDGDIVPLLEGIDHHLERAGYDMNDEYSMATERYAYLGELALLYGMDVIPKPLRPFYAGVIHKGPHTMPD